MAVAIDTEIKLRVCKPDRKQKNFKGCSEELVRSQEEKYLQSIQTIKGTMDEKHTSWIKEAHSTSANSSL